MDKVLWKNAVFDVIHRIADESYQRTAWFGLGEKISSPDELYCELFDDLLYDEFLESDDMCFTSLQTALGVRLKDAMNKYAESTEDFSDPNAVYNDLRWNDIRQLAKAFLDSF